MAKITIKPDSIRVLGVYTPAFKLSDGDLILMSGVVSVDSDGTLSVSTMRRRKPAKR